jgi:hypothetical protein
VIICQLLICGALWLRRIERLSASIGDAQEHKTRIAPVVAGCRRQLQSLVDQITQIEAA